MQDPQTPQQALDIAATTTRQAHEGAVLPRWQPIAAAVSGTLAALLLCTVISEGIGRPFGWILLIGGIGSGSVFFGLAQLQRRTQRARGIVPLPMVEWKGIVGLLAVILVPQLVGYAISGSNGGWVRVASSVVLGGWIWFNLERPRILSWKTRPWR
jgi:hypothetical protein